MGARLVSLIGIPGQIVLGHLSDRIGREWVWTIGCLGFAICFAALIALKFSPRCRWSMSWCSRKARSATA